MTGKSALPVLSVLVAVLFGSLALALALGNGSFGWPDSAVDWQIVLEIRLPRALAALATGSLLALGGTRESSFHGSPVMVRSVIPTPA